MYLRCTGQLFRVLALYLMWHSRRGLVRLWPNLSYIWPIRFGRWLKEEQEAWKEVGRDWRDLFGREKDIR